jgi:hypothetical protein
VASLTRKTLIITVLFLLAITLFCNVAYAQNYERRFDLLNNVGGQVRYSLTVSITSSLYNYYRSKSHVIYSSADFATLITPYPVKPIADKLRELYSDDEIFVDMVLGITHQVPYDVYPEVYPVETLVLNKGDCGGFSLLVASILKAGGLDVVLFEYTSKEHMNVGVALDHKPVYARGGTLYYVVYNGKNYYVAESTGGNLQDGWRVGECPPELKSINPHVITLENYDQTEFGQVSASLKELSPSQISISTSASFVIENSVITITGAVMPSSASNVTIYVGSFGGEWRTLATVSISNNGMYAYEWKPQSGGVYYLEASWSGNEDYAGADSAILTLWVVPFYGIVAGVLGIMLLTLVTAFWLMNRRGTATPPPAPAIEESTSPTSPLPEEAQQPSAEAPQPPASQTETEQTQTAPETPPTEEPQRPVEETPPITEENPPPPPAPTEPEPQPTQTEQPSQPEPAQEEKSTETSTENPT